MHFSFNLYAICETHGVWLFYFPPKPPVAHRKWCVLHFTVDWQVTCGRALCRNDTPANTSPKDGDKTNEQKPRGLPLFVEGWFLSVAQKTAVEGHTLFTGLQNSAGRVDYCWHPVNHSLPPFHTNDSLLSVLSSVKPSFEFLLLYMI